MNIRHNEALIEKLAAEYVLGTLRGGARRRFETWMHEDATLRRAVAEWQDRLQPMAEFSTAVTPPPRVWQIIEQKLALKTASSEATGGRRSFWLGLREDLSFWRGLGLVSTTLATVLLAVLLARQPDQALPTANYVAMLANDKAQAVAMVTGHIRDRKLVIKVMQPQQVAADKSLELWAVPKDGPPRSLGVIAADGSFSMPMPENASPQSVPVLAVTLEPRGGSPNPNGPTGPVVFKGAWMQI